MSGSAGVAGAYEVEEGKARMSDGYFAGDDREQEDDIILLTRQRSEVS
jgi:hypothetical protein